MTAGAEVFLPSRILLVGWEPLDLIMGPPLFVYGKVTLIDYRDAREFVVSFLTRIQSKDLVCLVLICAQVEVILHAAVRQSARTPD